MRRVLAFTLLLSVCAAAASCDRDRPYRIGVVLDADGVYAAREAARAVNAGGGIHGHLLELQTVGGASSTSARVALEAAETLAADPAVLAVVGHTNSSASLAASQVYNARHVTQIAPTSSTPLYSRAGPYSFRLVASDAYQGAFLAHQVLDSSPRPRTAVVFVNDDYGRALAGVLLRDLHAAGSDPVYATPYVESDSFPDGGAIAAAVVRANPAVLIWIGRAAHFARVAPEVRRALPSLTVLASDGFGGPAVVHDSLHVLAGTRYVRFVDLSRRDAALSRLLDHYREHGLGEPTDQAVLAYDAVLLLAEAMARTGANRDAIRAWLASVGHSTPAFHGLSGPIAFVAGGDRAPAYVLGRVPDMGMAMSATDARQRAPRTIP